MNQTCDPVNGGLLDISWQSLSQDKMNNSKFVKTKNNCLLKNECLTNYFLYST